MKRERGEEGRRSAPRERLAKIQMATLEDGKRKDFLYSRRSLGFWGLEEEGHALL